MNRVRRNGYGFDAPDDALIEPALGWGRIQTLPVEKYSEVQQKLAIRRPACRKLGNIVCVQRFFGARAAGELAIEIGKILAVGIENDGAAIGRPDRIQFKAASKVKRVRRPRAES